MEKEGIQGRNGIRDILKWGELGRTRKSWRRGPVMTNKSTRGRCAFHYTTEVYSPRTCCPGSYRSHFISCFSHPREDTVQTQKEESYALSTATLVNVKRFTGEQLSNSIRPDSPSYPNHCVQLSSDQSSAQGFLATIHYLHTNLQDRV